MRYSQLLLKTTKEKPADASSKNAEYLVRGGFISKTVAGAYSYLPLGLKVLKKIEQIVREEMNNVGAQEMFMSALASKENWQRTGRWETVDVLYKIDTGHGDEVVLSPTHEETVTPILQNFATSPKDFPKCVYHIQTKFRNEARVKSGLLRGREFLMKDAYSFHLSQEDFEAFYDKMKIAYKKVYKRLGLGDITVIAAASGGDFSRFSHEFQTFTEIGEDLLFLNEKTGEYFNKEIVSSQAPKVENQDTEMKEYQEIEGKGIIGVEDLAAHLGVKPQMTVKTVFFTNEKKEIIACAVRGTYEIDEEKVRDILECKDLKMLSEEKIREIFGTEPGYAGMKNLPDTVIQLWDESCSNRINFEMGCNRTNYHAINVNFSRDIPLPKKFYDIKVAQKGDINPETGKVFPTFKASEVGNIFPLSTKFSQPFNFTVQNENGENVPVIMGCYGIGVSRLMGVIAEIFSDEKGLKWPSAVAPAQIYLAPIGREDRAYTEAEAIYEKFREKNIEVLYDDRRDKKTGPGQKFADHELLGIPHRIVISPKTLENDEVEIFSRENGKTEMVKISELETKFI